mmetsp:Transcript_29485/g.44562  ORF Transcript_29485/g.44562 Transcript_29485/m.44562 type:complete len:592 (-) Transcript_29485:289-2064(-)
MSQFSGRYICRGQFLSIILNIMLYRCIVRLPSSTLAWVPSSTTLSPLLKGSRSSLLSSRPFQSTSPLRMASSYVGALDQGTSSTRFVLVDSSSGKIVASSQKEHTQYYPQPGWVEHDAAEIWTNSHDVIVETLNEASESLGISPEDVKSIGITNQRETTVLWDRVTGEPACPAIVWNCARTADVVHDIVENFGGDKDAFRNKTGLPLSTYFSATKLVWLFQNIAGLKERAQNGELCFGTIDSWLTWKLTGGKHHVTDVTNAARTLLCNINTLEWDEELLNAFDIPACILPTIEPSIDGDFGTISSSSSDANMGGCDALANTRIGAILGDQHAATFGQACFSPGEVKVTFGTGSFLLMNTGTAPKISTHGLLTTPFYQRKGEDAVYALEGAVAVAGSLIQWLRDNMQLGASAKEIAELAATVKDAEGLRFVPAFNGLFAPHWRDDARGVICGLTAYHTRAHMARAALDAAAFQAAEVFEAMSLDADVTLEEVKVDGGMAANNQVVQFLADISSSKVSRPKSLETTAMGVAYAAGLAVGEWKALDEIRGIWEVESTFIPNIEDEERSELKRSWSKAIDRSKGWVDSDEKKKSN